MGVVLMAEVVNVMWQCCHGMPDSGVTIAIDTTSKGAFKRRSMSLVARATEQIYVS